MSDPTIEQIEAELRESRVKAWDVETFLAKRHQAKIDALTKPGDKRERRWQVGKDLTTLLFAAIGYLTVMTIIFFWGLNGEFPLRGVFGDEYVTLRKDDYVIIKKPAIPPPAGWAAPSD